MPVTIVNAEEVHRLAYILFQREPSGVNPIQSCDASTSDV